MKKIMVLVALILMIFGASNVFGAAAQGTCYIDSNTCSGTSTVADKTCEECKKLSPPGRSWKYGTQCQENLQTTGDCQTCNKWCTEITVTSGDAYCAPSPYTGGSCESEWTCPPEENEEGFFPVSYTNTGLGVLIVTDCDVDAGDKCVCVKPVSPPAPEFSSTGIIVALILVAVIALIVFVKKKQTPEVKK